MSDISFQERQAFVVAAADAIRSAAWGNARQLLHAALNREEGGMTADLTTFLALRLLGQVTREMGDLPTSRAIYRDARRVAAALKRPDLDSAALEGLALVARADENHEESIELYELAARRALDGGDALGHATVLANKGEALTSLRRFSEAEATLREALTYEPMTPDQRAIVEDNLSLAIAGSGRFDEALEIARGAADRFESAGMHRDLAKALSNIEGHQRRLDQLDEAAATFARRFELLRRLAAEAIDDEHYARYGERVRAIEAETRRALMGEADANCEDQDGDLAAALEIGISAYLGEQLGTEGDRRVEAGQYRAAEQSYLQALAHWEHLGAHHALPRVHFSLGMLYTEVGPAERALEHLVLARQQAHALGDAHRESAACANLCRLVLDSRQPIAGLDEIELLVHARALEPLSVRQLIGPSADAEQLPVGASTDGGVLDSLETSICMQHGALDLAERAVRRSIAQIEGALGEEGGELYRYRLALRLVKLYSILRRQERDAEADAIEVRLNEINRIDGHPRIMMAVNGALGLEQFARDEWSEVTLDRLRAACDAYELTRGQAQAVGGPLDRLDLHQPPFDEAIEVALSLGLTEAAFGLLERSKARTLLEAFRARDIPALTDPALVEEARLWGELSDARAAFDRVLPDESPSDRAKRLHRAEAQADEIEPQLQEIWDSLEADHPDLVAHRLARPATSEQVAIALADRASPAVVIELFVGPRSVQAFTISATRGIAVHRFVDANDADWLDLVESMRHFEGKRVHELAMAALGHPSIRTLSVFIEELAHGDPVFLVPHRFLHSLPLHLSSDGQGAFEASRQTFYLPSASLLRYVCGYDDSATKVVVGGDPLGDLPFARLEAAATAGRFSGVLATGSDCTAQWLADQLMVGHPPLRLLHLACHAIFHPRRGERSGIALADGDRALVLDLAELAVFDWSSALTVLSACSSGQSQVNDGDELTGMTHTLLARGAATIIVALWEVPDLATYLLVTKLYDQLPAGSWTLGEVGDALSDAQRALRATTARDLVDLALTLKALAVESPDAGTERCALAATARAHRAAGNNEQSLIWGDAARYAASGETSPADAGTPDWSTLRAVAAGPEYLATPFADPVNWAAFVLSGCG